MLVCVGVCRCVCFMCMYKCVRVCLQLERRFPLVQLESDWMQGCLWELRPQVVCTVYVCPRYIRIHRWLAIHYTTHYGRIMNVKRLSFQYTMVISSHCLRWRGLLTMRGMADSRHFLDPWYVHSKLEWMGDCMIYLCSWVTPGKLCVGAALIIMQLAELELMRRPLLYISRLI